jgi:NitT/TauT family transport system substrate-binding protein
MSNSMTLTNRMRRRGPRTLAIALALTVTSAFLAACGSGGDDGASSDGSFVLSGVNGDPSNGPSGAPWGSVQIAEGMDKDSGYTLKWDVAQSAVAGLQLLSAGKVNMAQSSAPTAYAAAKLDPDLRIIGFLAGPAYLIVAPEGSGISSAADLKGKTIGVLALGSASDLMTRGALKEAGLDPDKDVKFLPVGVGAPMAEALDSGKVDAIAGWEGMWESISALTKTPLAPVQSAMSDLPGMMLQTTTQEMIDDHRKELVAYMQNFYKACALAAADPKRAVADHWEVFSNVKPPAAEYDKQLADQASWNQDFFKICEQPSADTGIPGVLSDDEVAKTYDFLRSNNVLEDDVDTSKVVDTSITEDALKDVDVDAWAKQYLADNPSK